jgi:hypothetical protein
MLSVDSFVSFCWGLRLFHRFRELEMPWLSGTSGLVESGQDVGDVKHRACVVDIVSSFSENTVLLILGSFDAEKALIVRCGFSIPSPLIYTNTR